MYRCPAEPDQGLLPEVEVDLFREIPFPDFEQASLDKGFGIRGPDADTADCSVQIAGTERVMGKRGDDGAIVRMHDLIRDPPLADCSLKHSEHAGRTLMRWLKAAGIPLHFVGSSFLMRAFETAVAMFLEPCFDGKVNCTGVIDPGLTVTQVPYLTERALPGRTSVSADCVPRAPERQSELMKQIYAREKDLHIDTGFAEGWPRDEQHFEKFKAFMATQLVPSLGQGMPWAAAPRGPFRRALEKALGESMARKDHGRRVAFSWRGGSYKTGDTFTRTEYDALHAPEVVLAIVGHSAMMLEYCLGGRGTPPANNAVLEKLFIMEATPRVKKGDSQHTDIVLRELDGPCPLVMSAISGSLALENLFAEDVAACEKTFPVVELLKLRPGGFDDDGHTACERLAKDGDAFTIQPEFRVEAVAARA